MEVELRAKLRNPKKIIQKLTDMGAVKIGQTQYTDYYFGNTDLYEKIGYSFWIRLRLKGSKVELAYKGSTGKNGVYDEYEQELQDLKTSQLILKKMGLKNEITVHKKRISFKVGNISIEIDSFRRWGTFIEVEIISNKPDKTKLFELLKSLGIDKKDIFERGYITLMLEKISP